MQVSPGYSRGEGDRGTRRLSTAQGNEREMQPKWGSIKSLKAAPNLAHQGHLHAGVLGEQGEEPAKGKKGKDPKQPTLQPFKIA